MKTLKNHRGKMSVRANVRMSKIMRTLIKEGVRTYVRDEHQVPNLEELLRI